MIRLRDPVHNFITFDEDEIRVINLDVLQRLRGIRQLAMESLVYPGALHSRFDHTLGVAHVAGQLADELGVKGSDRRLVRMARYRARPVQPCLGIWPGAVLKPKAVPQGVEERKNSRNHHG